MQKLQNLPPRITIFEPSDFHVHYREGAQREAAVKYHARFRRSLAMPNLSTPISTHAQADQYARELAIIHLNHCSRNVIWPRLEADHRRIFTTMQICGNEISTGSSLGNSFRTPECVQEIKRIPSKDDRNVLAVKVYPRWVTTNSQNGLDEKQYKSPGFDQICGACVENDVVMCLHGEHPSEDICYSDKENAFLYMVDEILERHPGLKVVLEHITTAHAVRFVTDRCHKYKLGATITAHHMHECGNDVLGYGERSKGMMQPHLHCKPFPKKPTDRDALRAAALSGHQAFFFGSDSALHMRSKKVASECCAGVFSAPTLPSKVIEVFDTDPGGTVENLEKFLCLNGPQFYGLQAMEDKITFTRDETFDVKQRIEVRGVEDDCLVPYCAGQTLGWSWPR